MSEHRFFEYDTWVGRGFWFRIWGYGLHVSRRATHPMLFSERNGYIKALYVGPLRIKALRPSRASRKAVGGE